MVETNPYDCVVVLGATATGKTTLGVSVARVRLGEILSADSRQVYRGLDLGSGKDLCEYGTTPYHLIDIADLSAEYSVFDYQRDFYRAFADVRSRGRLPVVVGGTGMYLDAVIRGYGLPEVPEDGALRARLEGKSLEELASILLSMKREVHNRTDLLERARLVRAIEIAEYNRSRVPRSEEGHPPVSPLVLGTRFDRSVLRARIKVRLDARLEAGLVDEVRGLHDARGVSWERLERLGLEYRFTAFYLQGKISSEREYVEGLRVAIGQFAKRQETWFRGMERKGVGIRWIDGADPAEAESLVARYFPPERI